MKSDMIRFMCCPVHKTKNIVAVNKLGVQYVFLCKDCMKYYVHVSNKEEGTPLDIEDKTYPAYSTKNRVYISTDPGIEVDSIVIKTSEERAAEKEAERLARIEGRRKTKKEAERIARIPGKQEKSKVSIKQRTEAAKKVKKVTDSSIVQNASKNTNEVTIQKITEENTKGRLKYSYERVKREYPKIAPENMDISTFIQKIFPSMISQKCHLRNMTYLGGNGYNVRKVEIYNTNSGYLKHKLPDNTFVAFTGRVSQGEFSINDIRVLENPVVKSDDVNSTITFYYDDQKRSSCLYDFTSVVAENPQTIGKEITSWDAYLDWKKQLAQLRIKGIKYIGFRIDVENRQMTFLTVAEGKDSFDDIKRYIRRNEVSVFSNNYSSERWVFQFNHEYQDLQSNDSGIPLGGAIIGRHYGAAEVIPYDWDIMRGYAKTYSTDEEAMLDARHILSNISRTYVEPYFTEVTFDLSSNALESIDRQLQRNGVVDDGMEEFIAQEFYGDGYIATSQIGDFALIRRLKNAIADLVNGKSISQGLDQWLFDITKARTPETVVTIEESTWQNKTMNPLQKRAVEKILSVPDVCLIQGPPGTGKTTVIAEAIYQLAIRNKRILVASQANLAVDNALERLISNPKIRAIRLGRKVDKSVSQITENNVLEAFYTSLVDFVEKEYVGKWKEADAIMESADSDYEKFLRYKNQSVELHKEQRVIKEQIQAIDAEWNSEQQYSMKKENKVEKINLLMLRSYCQGNEDTLELALSKQSIIAIWESIHPNMKELYDKGLVLTRVTIDEQNLDTIERIDKSNDILQHIVMNVKRAIRLQEKLNSSMEFGGEFRELEELKIREKKLGEKFFESEAPEDLQAWKEVKKQIMGLNNAGFGLQEDEKELFHQEELSHYTNANLQEHLLTLLRAARQTLDRVFADIIGTVNALLQQIEEAQRDMDAACERKEDRKRGLQEENSNLSAEIDTCEAMCQKVLTKYKAAPDDIAAIITERKEEAKKLINTTIDRNVWEDVFVGLQTWVDQIPDYEQERNVYKKDFINGCNVVGVSCTENARTLYENGFEAFDVVIIDEVSKATPPELLLPMLRGKKIILVGDHRQLPPLFNEHEKTYQEVAEQQEVSDDPTAVQLTMEDFNKYKDMVTASLFEQYFANAGDAIKETLRYQYRMHKDIMDIVNMFYNDYLKDGNEEIPNLLNKAHHLAIDSAHGTEMIVPERHAYWFDSSELYGKKVYEQRKEGSTSAENIVEAEIIMELLKKMELQYSNMRELRKPVSVGVISFYYDQVTLLRNMVRKESFHVLDIDVNTVDRFQGKEKEIVFVSLVRNTKRAAHTVNSHIAAFQRINVAFSRAENLLLIVGAKDMYAKQPVSIPSMNNGVEETSYIYRRIIEMLDQKAAYFTSDEIIPEGRAEDIIRQLREGDNE